MASVNESHDVLFPEDSYEVYYHPGHATTRHSRDYDYGSQTAELQQVFKEQGWSGRNDYAVIPPSSKRKTKKVCAVDENRSGQSLPRRAHNAPTTVSQSFRYDSLSGRVDHQSPPQRAHSLRDLKSAIYSPNVKKSYADTIAQTRGIPRLREEGDNKCVGEDVVNTTANNNSVQSKFTTNNKGNYSNPYRRRVPLPEGELQQRHRSWSPGHLTTNVLPGNMGAGSSFQKKNQLYQSNDTLQQDVGPLYEDISDHLKDNLAPPNITPVSGRLAKSQDQVVLRPIAFKPVLPRPNSYVSSPAHPSGDESSSRPASVKSNSQDGGYKSTSHDDGYLSQGSHSASIVSQVSVASLQLDHHEATVSFASVDSKAPCDRPESKNSSNPGLVSSNHVAGYMQTPSPSDSGVSELEMILREKDAEIMHLRETMEHNERVIFQVAEEKYHMWQMEIQDLSADFQRRLNIQQQDAYKMEQAFQLQVYKLQQDKEKLQTDLQLVKHAKENMGDQLARISEDLKTAAVQRDQANTLLSEKCNEVTILKEKLCDSQTKVDSCNQDCALFKDQILKAKDDLVAKESLVKQLQKELSVAEERLSRLEKSDVTSHSETSGVASEHNDTGSRRLKEELESRNREIKQQRELFENERLQWLEEKDKVIRYQKQLQSNYVQMMHKNKVLESQVQNLTLEKRGTNAKLIDKCPREESLC